MVSRHDRHPAASRTERDGRGFCERAVRGQRGEQEMKSNAWWGDRTEDGLPTKSSSGWRSTSGEGRPRGEGRGEAAGPINTEWTQFFAVLYIRCLFLYRSPLFLLFLVVWYAA